MRISDWSSDVCSSDLGTRHSRQGHRAGACAPRRAIGKGPQAPARRQARIRPVAVAAAPTPAVARATVCRGAVRRGSMTRHRIYSIAVASVYPHYIAKAEKKGRSEEHTSELQSLMRISYAVFCLKKTKKQIR